MAAASPRRRPAGSDGWARRWKHGDKAERGLSDPNGVFGGPHHLHWPSDRIFRGLLREGFQRVRPGGQRGHHSIGDVVASHLLARIASTNFARRSFGTVPATLKHRHAFLEPCSCFRFFVVAHGLFVVECPETQLRMHFPDDGAGFLVLLEEVVNGADLGQDVESLLTEFLACGLLIATTSIVVAYGLKRSPGWRWKDAGSAPAEPVSGKRVATARPVAQANRDVYEHPILPVRTIRDRMQVLNDAVTILACCIEGEVEPACRAAIHAPCQKRCGRGVRMILATSPERGHLVHDFRSVGRASIGGQRRLAAPVG